MIDKRLSSLTPLYRESGGGQVLERTNLILHIHFVLIFVKGHAVQAIVKTNTLV